MAELTVQVVALAGITPAYAAAAAGGDTVKNDGRIFLHFKNTNAAARNVTITPQRKYRGVTLSPVTVAIPLTTGDKMIGPFDPEAFNQADGTLAITYDAVTNLTVAAVRLP